MPISSAANGRARLSAAIITRNEERNIAECLESLSFVDEIVIVDSGSTDATLEIAGHYPVQILSQAFHNFASQKNEAIRQTSGDWILLIDADERISPALAGEIRQIIQDPQAADGYWILRHNFFFENRLRFGAGGNDRQLRLLRRGKGRFEGAVHERIHLQGKEGLLRFPMLHYSTRNLEDYFKRFPLYTGFEAEMIYRQGLRPTAFHIAVKPLLEFIYFYFARLGFLDGITGLQYQVLSSFYTSAKYIRALELFKKNLQFCEAVIPAKAGIHGSPIKSFGDDKV